MFIFVCLGTESHCAALGPETLYAEATVLELTEICVALHQNTAIKSVCAMPSKILLCNNSFPQRIELIRPKECWALGAFPPAIDFADKEKFFKMKELISYRISSGYYR